MKASTRAMLLSGLIYPGVGQLLAGHRRAGLFFVAGTSAGLIVLFYRLMRRAYRVIEQAIPRLAQEAPDMGTLKELVAQSATGGWGVENLCLMGIVGCWLAAIVHAYWVGKKIDT